MEREKVQIKCLQEADVIGVTITGAAKYNAALSQVNAKICVIEEAAEVLEPHIISALTGHTQQLIMIGDHKQLRPRTASYEIAHKYKLEVSLFERLVNNDFPIVTLNVQHRMRPEISRFVSKHIYNDKLKNCETVYKFDNIRGMQHNMFFLDHQEPEREDNYDFSKINEHEANFVVSLSNYLLQNGYKPEEVTILTPYSGQMFCIRNHKNFSGSIRVTTVDNYQGEENTIILLSMVRSNNRRRMGFIKDSNRVCVAISRAREGFYCIGNFSMYRKYSLLWKAIIEDVEECDTSYIGDKLPLQCKPHQKITMVASATDFIKLVPEGGCDKICDSKLACGHFCKRKCHSDDHISPCQEPCLKQCERGLHTCQGKCGEKCPPCSELIEKQIPMCGHSQKVPCSMPPTDFSCKMNCNKTLLCGHPCKLTCGENCHSKPCRMLVEKKWPCGHSEKQVECYTTDFDLAFSHSCSFPCDATLACLHKCSGTCGKCHQGRLHTPCKKKCERTLICGHKCPEICTKNCPPCKKRCLFKCPHFQCEHNCSTKCKPCSYPCQWDCKHHRCQKKCGEICDRPRCNKPCKKTLKKCGHECIGLCGEPCPDLCKICDKDSDVFKVSGQVNEVSHLQFITLTDCSHVFEITFLDNWVDRAPTKIDWIRCPKCNIPILTTLRYLNRVKEIRQSINFVKDKKNSIVTIDERQHYIYIVQNACDYALMILKDRNCLSKSLCDTLKRLLEQVKVSKGILYNNDAFLECNCIFTQSIFEGVQYVEKLSEKNSFTFDEVLRSKLRTLSAQTLQFLKWIVSCWQYQPYADQLFNDLVVERRRIVLLGELYFCGIYSPYVYNGLASTDLGLIQQIQLEYECLGKKPDRITQDYFERAFAELYALFGCSIVLQGKLKVLKITNGFNSKLGSWFKCVCGKEHIYHVGECGQAINVETTIQHKCLALNR